MIIQAVPIIVPGTILGHLSKKISFCFHIFIQTPRRKSWGKVSIIKAVAGVRKKKREKGNMLASETFSVPHEKL